MAELIKIARAAPVPDVIHEAEKVLKLAKSGELRSLVWIGDSGSAVSSNWTGYEDGFVLLAHLARLQHKLQRSLDEGAEYAACPSS